jgi:hypothetical protein
MRISCLASNEKIMILSSNDYTNPELMLKREPSQRLKIALGERFMITDQGFAILRENVTMHYPEIRAAVDGLGAAARQIIDSATEQPASTPAAAPVSAAAQVEPSAIPAGGVAFTAQSSQEMMLASARNGVRAAHGEPVEVYTPSIVPITPAPTAPQDALSQSNAQQGSLAA